MEPPFETSDMRVRPPSIERKTENASYIAKQSWEGPGQSYTADEGPVTVWEKSKRMYDIVNPQFKKRQANGEIFNNRMFSEISEITNPLVRSTGRQKEGSGSYTVFTLDHTLPPPYPRLMTKVPQGVIDNAITDAYARVTANEGNTLLWIGEMKETLSMLKDIGEGLRRLYEATKKKRIAWAKGKLTVEGQQQLTLQILYGILPLEQQIADFLEGLFRTKDPSTRHTARSFRLKTDETSYEVDTMKRFSNVNLYKQHIRQTISEHVTYEVRAGVMFELDITNTPWVSIIMEPKAVISTAYALARLSFVIDWFVNVGGTLAAWSPSAGVKELSAWVTVKATHDMIGITQYLGDNTSFQAVNGQGQFSVRTETKYRMPISRADLSVIPPIDLNLDIEKLLALVLLFAKVKRQ